MNQKIQPHITEDSTYIPETGTVYPEIPDEALWKPVKTKEVDVENDYPFLDKSLKGRLLNWGVTLGIYTIVHLVGFFRFGLKVEGRKNIHKNKKLFKNGAMTICNHVHRWDFCFVLIAIRKGREWFPAKKSNIETSDANFIRGAGGIPIPESMGASRRFNQAFDELASKKKWIHVFPESCRWDYYQPIRPFKIGAFKMAYRYKYPVIPLAISYRKPTGLWKLFGVKHPLLTIKIGEPVSVEKPEGLSKNEFCEQLRQTCHQKVCELAGIKQNCWESDGD